MRIGLFGGSFDPIHRGHVAPIRVAMRDLGLDGVEYLPTARPPHKLERGLVGAHRRYCMVELALLEDRGLRVSPKEMEGRVSYTVETLEHYRATWPEADLFLILGADSLFELTTWRRWRDILSLATLAVLSRSGWVRSFEGLHPDIRAAQAAGRVLFVVHQDEPASSTEIRGLLASGSPIPAGWMDRSVLDYIRKYELYR